jgi:hypothetical protein
MIKTSNKKPGLIGNREPGAIKPQKTETKVKKVSKVKGSNQSHTMKLPESTYKKLGIIKQINAVKFDYQAIDFLVDHYINNASTEEIKAYNILYKTIK